MKKIDLRKQKRPNSSGKSPAVRARQHRMLLAALDENRARSTISKRLIGWLFRNLSRTFREIHGQLISAAISRACLGHRRNPEAFDAGCGVPLEHYLLFNAARNLADLIETQRRYPLKFLPRANHIAEIDGIIGQVFIVMNAGVAAHRQ